MELVGRLVDNLEFPNASNRIKTIKRIRACPPRHSTGSRAFRIKNYLVNLQFLQIEINTLAERGFSQIEDDKIAAEEFLQYLSDLHTDLLSSGCAFIQWEEGAGIDYFNG